VRLEVVLTGVGLGGTALLGVGVVRQLGPEFGGVALLLELLLVPAILLVGFGSAIESNPMGY
jgi:hypothetical protein